jgi:hypothetical protein
MRKGLLTLSLVSSVLASSLVASEVTKADLEALKKEVAELKATMKKAKLSSLKEQVKELKIRTGGDNLKLSADLRTSFDVINYKLGNGTKKDNNIWSNRVRINMDAQPRKDLVFLSQFQVNKMFGQTSQTTTFNSFDWFSSETPDDSTLRLRKAYFVYFGDLSEGTVPYTFSLGRRPAINGITGNLREDDQAESPIAHNINMEFDGASLNFKLEKVVNIPGFAFKWCAGRGYSNADGKYSQVAPSYAENMSDTSSMDMLGFIMKAYDDGQYSATVNMFHAYNVLGNDTANAFTNGFKSVGDLEGGAITFQANGIGEFINDFLDDTKFFASVAYSKTLPNDGMAMLGSSDDKVGYSFYTGVQFPCQLVDDAKVGLEFNHGSKYWRSFTYGEDTLIGSKVAARGNAYEAYWTKDLLDDVLSMQLRYTHIDYDYTGSDMFFGMSGTPMDTSSAAAGNYVKEANNFRAYMRYRY